MRTLKTMEHYGLNQARNQEFFRAGEVSENKGTPINIWSETDKRMAPQGKISEIFFLDRLKTVF